MVKKKQENFDASALVTGLFTSVTGVGASYGFGSWAIDSGSILLYLLCFAALYYGLRQGFRTVKKAIYSDGERKAKSS